MRVTDSDNAITNGLEMRQGPSGATQLMSCNNDDALRIFDAGSGFKCTGCALCQPPISPICKPSLAAQVAHLSTLSMLPEQVLGGLACSGACRVRPRHLGSRA